MPPKTVNVIAKGDFGYHPASGQYLRKGEHHTIEENAFSAELFDLVDGKRATAAKSVTNTEGGAD